MKIKPLTKEQLIISTDRLMRFKEPEIKYLRVFKEIILSNLIEPKFKKSELDGMDYKELRDYAVSVINFSLGGESSDLTINKRISDYENSVFKISDNAQVLLDNKINYFKINEILRLRRHSEQSLPCQREGDREAVEGYSLPCQREGDREAVEGFCEESQKISPQNDNFSFPIKKILLCEGITEEILLPKFAQIMGVDFKKSGIHIVSAGGKNQVVKYFYRFAECLKIPVFVLLDNDAVENKEQIIPKLRQIDKIHLVKSGEFEDLLPKSLVIKTLNYLTENISTAPIEGLEEAESTVEFLEEFFRHRGLHEFKKADFAQAVRENIATPDDLSDEIKEIITSLC